MKKLTRSKTDRKVSGLSAGIAHYLDVDVTAVRVVMLALIIMSGVLPGILFYFIATIITPVEGV
ncbi:PspC domain-containing protein [Candidatus Parcubacteria bacterium]|nr:PspC domain-containing protein [Candidatus Parcubacteria bacterium]